MTKSAISSMSRSALSSSARAADMKAACNFPTKSGSIGAALFVNFLGLLLLSAYFIAKRYALLRAQQEATA